MFNTFQFSQAFLFSFQLHSTTMDPTTVQPSSPEESPPSPPPYLPQNPHNPTDAIIEASASDCFQNGEPSTSRNFKALVCKIAGRLLPAHQSLIEQRFDDILPHELLVPDHPPYADMILTALWELKAEGGSSEEAISHFIKNEYHELPWAHATILNHHLRDLCIEDKITLTHDGCYILGSSITKPEPNNSPSPSPSPSPSSSSPLSSAYSSSSTSPSSSSSSLSWSGSYRTRKRKKIKRRKGKIVKVRGRDKGRGRGRGRCRGRFTVEGRNKLVEPGQGTKDQNAVTVMEIEDYANKDGDLPDVVAKISEEENLPCEQNNKNNENQYRPLKEEPEIDVINVPADDEVTVLEVDVKDAKVDEHVEQLEHEDEKVAIDMEHNQQEENQQSDNVERQTLAEERVMNNENLSEEQDSVMIQCVEPNKQLNCLNKEQVDTKAQSANLHDDDDDDDVNDDDVIEKPVHPQEQCVGKIEESPQSCEQDHLKHVEVESAEQEEQQTEVNQEEIVVAEVQQDQSVEMIEQQNKPCIQQTDVSEKDSLQEKNNPVTNVQNMTSSGGTTEEKRRLSRPGLRSSSKKEVAASNSKKQLELVTPIRRSLRSNKTIPEAAAITEIPDHSKEQVTHLGRTRSSKRKLGIVEAELVSNTRKTRRTGL